MLHYRSETILERSNIQIVPTEVVPNYDEGSGVQAHIFKINDLAKFVPCAAHSLNLVGVHAAEVSVIMISFFWK
ncbi:unnamed protein product, partial [Larinioides sclopetarius]